MTPFVHVDLHLHSAASFDCGVSPDLVAGRASSLGLGPIFLTDHDTIEGAAQLRRAGLPGIVAGEEISTRDGELIGLFLEAPVEPGAPALHTARAIKAQGGLVYVPHPLDESRPSLTAEAIDGILEHIDIVEACNGRATWPANRFAAQLCQHLGATPGAGSDAHTLAEVGAVWVELEEFDGPRDFLRKLARARIATRPQRPSLRALIGGITPARRNRDAGHSARR